MIQCEDFIKAQINSIFRQLEIEMDLASQNLKFEKAADLRDQIEAFRSLQSTGKKRVRKK